jgi:hypothetical protein
VGNEIGAGWVRGLLFVCHLSVSFCCVAECRPRRLVV